jgi:HPr kinase/phosphorylase
MNLPIQPTITVQELLESVSDTFSLKLVTGKIGLERKITVCHLQRLALALTGNSTYIDLGRIQVLGQSENSYLQQLPSEQQLNLIAGLPLSQITAILITKSLEPPKALLQLAEIANLPILVTPDPTAIAIAKLTNFLEQKLAPMIILHGVMVSMFGLGILLKGESGVGKSECALDLITRGHQLVSDDVVEVRRIGTEYLLCSAPEMVRDHMEIRGLGILNIKDLFGFSSVSLSQQLDLIIRLERWDQKKAYDRVGLDEEFSKVLEFPVPMISLPVTFGRNVSTLVEVAVRNHILKLRGINAVQEFTTRHMAMLAINTLSQKK